LSHMTSVKLAFVLFSCSGCHAIDQTDSPGKISPKKIESHLALNLIKRLFICLCASTWQNFSLIPLGACAFVLSITRLMFYYLKINGDKDISNGKIRFWIRTSVCCFFSLSSRTTRRKATINCLFALRNQKTKTA
jgi:hypothetical protein